MGGITTPVLTVLGQTVPGAGLIRTAGRVVNTVNQAENLLGVTSSRRKKRARQLLDAQQAADNADLTARQAADLADLQQRNTQTAARIQAESDIADRNRRRTLRQQTGSLRAALNAQGVSTADGSGEAVLLGRENAAAQDRADAARLDAIRLAGLSNDVTALQQRNLLDLTRQQERQRLDRLARGL